MCGILTGTNAGVEGKTTSSPVRREQPVWPVRLNVTEAARTVFAPDTLRFLGDPVLSLIHPVGSRSGLWVHDDLHIEFVVGPGVACLSTGREFDGIKWLSATMINQLRRAWRPICERSRFCGA